MHKHHKINYLEIPVKNISCAKDFFSKVFAWNFTDYGADYCAFNDGVLEGGFFHSELNVSVEKGSVLIVFYSAQLELTKEKIKQASGTISQDIFEFPGGRRFHFLDTNNNEYAVWSDI